MTEKIEHQNADAAGSAEAPSETAGSSEQPALPSIIVDPLLAGEAAAEAASTAAETATAPNSNGAAHANGAGPHATEPSNANDQLELSPEVADRLADNIRPSWEPPAPASAQPEETNAPSAAPATALPIARHVEELPTVLPGAHRQRGLLIAAAAVFGFASLAALGVWTSRAPVSPGAAVASAAKANEIVNVAASVPAAVGGPTSAAAQPPAEEVAVAPAPVVDPAALPPVEGAAGTVATAEATSIVPAEAPEAAAALMPSPDPVEPVASPTAEAAAAAPAPAPTVEPSTPAAKPAEPAKPATVHVRLKADPAHATLTLDNTPIPNPFEADVVKSRKHRVEARAPGHRDAGVTVEFNRDRQVALVLKPIVSAPAPAPAPKAARKPRAQRTAPRTPAKPPAGASKPDLRPAPAAPAPAAPSTRGAGFVSESPY